MSRHCCPARAGAGRPGARSSAPTGPRHRGCARWQVLSPLRPGRQWQAPSSAGYRRCCRPVIPFLQGYRQGNPRTVRGTSHGGAPRQACRARTIGRTDRIFAVAARYLHRPSPPPGGHLPRTGGGRRGTSGGQLSPCPRSGRQQRYRPARSGPVAAIVSATRCCILGKEMRPAEVAAGRCGQRRPQVRNRGSTGADPVHHCPGPWLIPRARSG